VASEKQTFVTSERVFDNAIPRKALRNAAKPSSEGPKVNPDHRQLRECL